MAEKHRACHALDTPGSMREYLPSQEALNDHSSKQRIRKQPKAGKAFFGTDFLKRFLGQVRRSSFEDDSVPVSSSTEDVRGVHNLTCMPHIYWRSTAMYCSGMDIEDVALFQKTTKGNRPQKTPVHSINR